MILFDFGNALCILIEAVIEASGNLHSIQALRVTIEYIGSLSLVSSLYISAALGIISWNIVFLAGSAESINWRKILVAALLIPIGSNIPFYIIDITQIIQQGYKDCHSVGTFYDILKLAIKLTGLSTFSVCFISTWIQLHVSIKRRRNFKSNSDSQRQNSTVKILTIMLNAVKIITVSNLVYWLPVTTLSLVEYTLKNFEIKVALKIILPLKSFIHMLSLSATTSLPKKKIETSNSFSNIERFEFGSKESITYPTANEEPEVSKRNYQDFHLQTVSYSNDYQ
ncbi:hypothetical protein HDV06_003430 [Boothiomyces sp. JEL0866]|nr:hypothetical protein HDV06_003382 [Boothiomyces sp. JEL0866]KAJ3325660.1 hypothetical protein HDV06_003430 [Boothiomyces sp. JEL0866]